jgi:hypothetical protein
MEKLWNIHRGDLLFDYERSFSLSDEWKVSIARPLFSPWKSFFPPVKKDFLNFSTVKVMIMLVAKGKTTFKTEKNSKNHQKLLQRVCRARNL